MEPQVTELNEKLTLTKAITINGLSLTEVTLKKLIIRPIMKRIVFMTEEFDRVIVYDGETEFEAHKNDSESDLTTKLLAVIDSTYGA